MAHKKLFTYIVVLILVFWLGRIWNSGVRVVVWNELVIGHGDTETETISLMMCTISKFKFWIIVKFDLQCEIWMKFEWNLIYSEMLMKFDLDGETLLFSQSRFMKWTRHQTWRYWNRNFINKTIFAEICSLHR